MNKVPDFLVEKNPGLPLYSVLDPEFAPYGQVLDLGDGGRYARPPHSRKR